MQLTITGTQVEIVGSNIVGFAQNNLVNTISATVDTPAEYTNIALKIYMNEPEQYNAIPFIREGDIIYTVLTSDMIPVGGRYIGQFEMSYGMMLFQTELFDFWVENSVNLNKAYTPIPSTFSQLATNVAIMQQHPPYPGDAGFWMIWNLAEGEYQQSNLPLPPVTKGDKGDTGPYFTPTVDAEGNLSWTNNGGLENPVTVNIRGPQGPQGLQGIQGPAGEIGNTGPQGPKGEPGAKGDTGAQGIPGQAATIQIGSVTNGDTISVTNSGSENAAILDFVLQRGEQGIQGPKGDIGPVGPKGDSGVGLPTVTEADNGKVAYVENGVWVAKLLSEIQGGV